MGIMHPIKFCVQQMVFIQLKILPYGADKKDPVHSNLSLQLKLFDVIWVSILWSWKYPLELVLNHSGMRVQNPSREKPLKLREC